MSEDVARPNIRIEIHNNLVEDAMEVDEIEGNSDNEDGEISDSNEANDNEDVPVIKSKSNRVWTNNIGGFTTGINIFDKSEQDKLKERAKRFQLKPNEIVNFTDEQLQELHDSLGVSSEDEKNIRFEAIHMRGTDEMSTVDVLDYFSKYGPAGIEWINDESCNVVWADKVSAARALFFLSSKIRGMPVEGPCDPFVKELAKKEEEEDNSGRSILLKNSHREVELQDDDFIDDKENTDTSVHVSDLTVPVPPGYWRLGVPCPKSKCILLRFSFKSDKKPYKAEKFSEYYKKYGNPNYGGIKGIISESHRHKIKSLFDRNREISGLKSGKVKNPWGELAETWDEDAQFCERIVVPGNNPPASKLLESSGIMKRLGFKRAYEENNVVEEEEVAKKSKIPRMKMYADEEEEKIRKKRLMAVKMQGQTTKSDLRSVLKPGRLGKKPAEKEKEYIEEDLGVKLKNRNRLLISEPAFLPKEKSVKEKIVYSKMRCDEEEKRKSSKNGILSRIDKHSLMKKNDSPPIEKSRYKSSMYSDYGEIDRKREKQRERRRRSDYDQEELEGSGKPRSKVAVVIKTQKRPTVASKIWSRLHSDREENRPVKSRIKRDYSSSSSRSSSVSSSSSKSDSSTNSSSSESSSGESDSVAESNLKVSRPGFRSNIKDKTNKSPLMIEITNDQFKKE